MTLSLEKMMLLCNQMIKLSHYLIRQEVMAMQTRPWAQVRLNLLEIFGLLVAITNGFDIIASKSAQIDAATYMSTLSRPRKRRGGLDDAHSDPTEYVCADGGCESLISENELLRCNAPGCELAVSCFFIGFSRSIYFISLVSLKLSRLACKTDRWMVLR
jgi:hypothetical protein